MFRKWRGAVYELEIFGLAGSLPLISRRTSRAFAYKTHSAFETTYRCTYMHVAVCDEVLYENVTRRARPLFLFFYTERKWLGNTRSYKTFLVRQWKSAFEVKIFASRCIAIIFGSRNKSRFYVTSFRISIWFLFSEIPREIHKRFLVSRRSREKGLKGRFRANGT